MCGFAGVVAWDERYRTSRATLVRMSAAIAHRGPDGEGMWFNHEAEITPDRPQVALAHHRLAIIDPDPRANQPFTDGQGRWLVFNGEIYNFKDLRSEISNLKPDYRWRTNCDTEVLLIAYDVWGEKCVEHLNGMFAFAVWDENTKELYLARDRMGQKPLYYAMSPAGIDTPLRHPQFDTQTEYPGPTAVAFASELPVLRSLGWFDDTIGQGCINDYLRWGYVPTPWTIYRGALKLPPGHGAGVKRQSMRPLRYFGRSASGFAGSCGRCCAITCSPALHSPASTST